MGRAFIESAPESKNSIYHCRKCKAYLADKQDVISTNFAGESGQAYLFKKTINVTTGPCEKRVMMTGEHYVRDIFCVGCKTKLGWVYELATRESERYKEGHMTLETKMIQRFDGFVENKRYEDVEVERLRAAFGEDYDDNQLRYAVRQRLRRNNVDEQGLDEEVGVEHFPRADRRADPPHFLRHLPYAPPHMYQPPPRRQPLPHDFRADMERHLAEQNQPAVNARERRRAEIREIMAAEAIRVRMNRFRLDDYINGEIPLIPDVEEADVFDNEEIPLALINNVGDVLNDNVEMWEEEQDEEPDEPEDNDNDDDVMVQFLNRLPRWA